MPFIARNSTLMRAPLAGMLICLSASNFAQFDWGVTTGTFHFALHQGAGPEVFSAERNKLPMVLGLWYRERPMQRFGLGLELLWSRRSFHGDYAVRGSGDGAYHDVHVDLSMVHLGVMPELRLVPNGRFLLRLGPQFALGAGGSMHGVIRSWSSGQPVSGSPPFSASARSLYKADLRLVLGFGIRAALGPRWVCTLDPYASFGITPITDPGLRVTTSEVGLRLSIGRHHSGRTITQRIGGKRPTDTDGQ